MAPAHDRLARTELTKINHANDVVLPGGEGRTLPFLMSAGTNRRRMAGSPGAHDLAIRHSGASTV
jgi:hypothetical protein